MFFFLFFFFPFVFPLRFARHPLRLRSFFGDHTFGKIFAYDSLFWGSKKNQHLPIWTVRRPIFGASGA